MKKYNLYVIYENSLQNEAISPLNNMQHATGSFLLTVQKSEAKNPFKI